MRKILYLILSVLAFTMAQPTLAQDARQRKPDAAAGARDEGGLPCEVAEAVHQKRPNLL